MKKLCVVLADYYKDVSKMLLDGATSEVLKDINNGVIKKVYHVPGAFEIPVTISKNINKYDGFVALGCVIKGETPHFDFISKATTDAIMKLSIQSQKPIGNGIITCLNKKQALIRSKTKGQEAAKAVLSVLKSFDNPPE